MTSDQDASNDRWTQRSLVVVIGVAGLLGACQDGATPPGAGQEGSGPVSQTARSCAEIVAGMADRVYFDYDSAELRAEARSGLDTMAADLLQQSQCRFVIEGPCDERGTREYNLALGEKRANVVMSYLAALGVDPARMETISYGKERPAVIGSTEAEWAKNRRAVMVFESGTE
jgi:peptidoglycan-associated lipoprotein